MDSDPLQISAELPLQAGFHPLGFPLHMATNSSAVLDAAADAWGCFAPAFAVPPISLRVLVESGDEPPQAPLFRAQQHLIVISGGANFAVCDHTRAFACCRLNSAAVADRDFIRYYFLEAMALFTLTQLHVTPVHAACVARGGQGLMLCGESGAGKSTLAYACAQRGWTYISDNESWLLRSDARTVLGNPSRIRLRDTAAELYPELAGRPAVIFNGKRSIVLETAGMDIAFACRPEHIVFLERTGQLASVGRIREEDACERLLAGVIAYTPEVRAGHRASLESFTEIPAVELRYRSIEDAVPALERMLD
jgi:hypothetical protein